MSEKATKAPNYTPEQESTIRDGYLAGKTVEELAETIGKTARSVTAKLSRMGIYKPKTYLTKAGEKPVKKNDRADAIGAILGLQPADVDSLTAANKRALDAIFSALANSTPIVATTPEQCAYATRVGEFFGLPSGETDILSRLSLDSLQNLFEDQL